MFFADFPKAAPVGVVWYSLVHHCDRAVSQWTVGDVAMASDPPDVSRAPVDVARLIVEDIVKRGRNVGQVTTGGVKDAFRFSSGA